MKKNIFRVLAFSALLAMGVNGAQAQRSYDCPPLNEEFKTMAEQVVQLNMDDPEKANKVFMNLTKKIKKNKEDLVAVGTYFLENDNYPAASQCAKAVYDLDPTYIPGLMFSGEVFMKAQRWGDAGQKFDEVLSIDPVNVSALKRNAFVYKNVNPHVAIDALNKIKEIDPSYTEADRNLGDIYYKLDKYGDAIKSYGAYYAAVPKEEGKLDVGSCENYLQALFSMSAADDTNLDKMIEVAAVLKPLAPNDILIPRMDFFAKFKKIELSMDYDGAVAAAEEAASYIKNKQFADSVYFYMDYDFAGQLAKEQRNLDEAINYYLLAVKDLEAKYPELTEDKKKEENVNKRGSYYYELSNLYVRNKQAEQGIEIFQKYLELLGDKADISDRYMLGTKYLAAYQQQDNTPEKKAEYFAKADDAFKAVIESGAENRLPIVLAYQQRARLNNTDTQKPLDIVRDYYQKVIEESNAPEVEAKAKNARFEACRYLFFYYVAIDTPNKEEATKYAEIAKGINPEDNFVKAAFEHIATM